MVDSLAFPVRGDWEGGGWRGGWGGGWGGLGFLHLKMGPSLGEESAGSEKLGLASEHATDELFLGRVNQGLILS